MTVLVKILLTPALIAAVTLLAPAAGIRPSAPARDAWRPPRWDLAFRMLAATAIVVVLTALAPRLGPTWTGLLSPFPVFALVLGVFTDRSEGPGAAARLLRGVVLGSLGHALQYALIALLIVTYVTVRAYLWASLGALGVNGLALMLARPVAARSRAAALPG